MSDVLIVLGGMVAAFVIFAIVMAVVGRKEKP